MLDIVAKAAELAARAAAASTELTADDQHRSAYDSTRGITYNILKNNNKIMMN